MVIVFVCLRENACRSIGVGFDAEVLRELLAVHGQHDAVRARRHHRPNGEGRRPDGGFLIRWRLCTGFRGCSRTRSCLAAANEAARTLTATTARQVPGDAMQARRRGGRELRYQGAIDVQYLDGDLLRL